MAPKKDKTPVAGGANKSPASGGKRPSTRSQTTPPVRATRSQTAASKATLVGPLGDSPRKKRKPTNPAPKKAEAKPEEEEAPPVPPPVPEPAEEKPAGDDGTKEAKEAGGSGGGGAQQEDDAAKRDKGKAVAEGNGEEEDAEDAAKAEKDGGDGEPKPGGGGVAAAERTIIIEHCKGCRSFKQRADELKAGLEIAVPGITVLLNPEFPAVQPRKGCFEAREEGVQVFISLLDMKRPFKAMKDLDMEEVVEDIVSKLN